MIVALALGAALTSSTSRASQGDPVLDAYLRVSSALAADDLTTAKDSAQELAKVSTAAKQEQLAAGAEALAGAPTIEAAREQFKAVSAGAVKLAQGRDGYYIMTCPMAQADWVQASTQVANPYYGKSMSSCGSLKKPAGSAASAMKGCCG